MDLSLVLARSLSSGGALGAALVGGDAQHFSLKHTRKTGFGTKGKTRSLAGPSALSSERKGVK